jgi:hypothetical protein
MSVNPVITDGRSTYEALYLLKKLDLAPEDGLVLPVVLPSELSPLDETLQQLAVDDLIVINARKNRYRLTARGSRTSAPRSTGRALVDEFDDHEVEDAIRTSRAISMCSGRDSCGWYEGEFDDLVVFRSGAVRLRSAVLGVLPHQRRILDRAHPRSRSRLTVAAADESMRSWIPSHQYSAMK